MSNPRPSSTELEQLVRRARWRASFGLYDGVVTDASQHFVLSCSHALPCGPEVLAKIIYTRDIGHHTSGWWKNPDYERCLHLSLSYCENPLWHRRLPHQKGTSEDIARAFFVDNAKIAWVEGPYSPQGRSADVWHYRVFCDAAWQPIRPRGEVYHRRHTPSGWRSFSDVHSYQPTEAEAPFLIAGSGRDV